MRREKTNCVIRPGRTLDVLEQFADLNTGESASPSLSAAQAHKNNVFALESSRGYRAEPRERENYRLGILCLQLGQANVGNMGVVTQARPVMAELARQARETVYVAMLRRGAMVPVEVVEPERAVRLASPLGSPLPLHCTAAGKALLAFEGEDELKALLPDGFAKHTERTPTDRAALAQQLKSVATSGYAIDMGEYVEDVRAVAVPIRDYARAVIATLAVSGPAYRFQAERIEKELAPMVAKAGREISSRLGYDLGRREA
jgi:DNA-binding IclR family transcriptional regulator